MRDINDIRNAGLAWARGVDEKNAAYRNEKWLYLILCVFLFLLNIGGVFNNELFIKSGSLVIILAIIGLSCFLFIFHRSAFMLTDWRDFSRIIEDYKKKDWMIVRILLLVVIACSLLISNTVSVIISVIFFISTYWYNQYD